MNKEILINILKDCLVLREEVSASQDSVMISCPFARWTHKKGTDDNPSFCLYLNDASYHCFACTENGMIWEALKSFGIMADQPFFIEAGNRLLDSEEDEMSARLTELDRTYDVFDRKEEVLDMSALQRWFTEKDVKNRTMFKYLESRGYPNYVDLGNEFDLAWDEHEERVLMPVYDLDDRFVGVIGRSIKDEDPKMRNYWGTKTTLGLGLPRFKGREKFDKITHLILVEGPFDMYRVFDFLVSSTYGEWMTVCCSFTSRCSRRQLEMLEEIGKTVYVMYDGDISGKKGAKEVSHALEGKVPNVEILGLSEGRDPDDLSREELQILVDK